MENNNFVKLIYCLFSRDALAGANDEDKDEEEDEFHEAQEGRPIQYWNGEGPCPTCGFA